MLGKLRGLGGLASLGAMIGRRIEHPLGDPKELRRVLDGIAQEKPFKAVDDVLGWLESLQGAEGFPEAQLLDVLSKLDDAARIPLRRLTADYVEHAHPTRQEAKRQWTLVHDFWTHLLAGYAKCLPDDAARLLGADGVASGSARLIAAAAAVRKWEQFHYRAAAVKLWAVAGRALRIAGEAGAATRSIRLHDHRGSMSSPQLEFIKLVAFQAASLDSLSTQEIEVVERLIAHFASGMVLAAEAEPDSVYWVDLADDRPPTRLAAMPPCAVPTQRFFKPGVAYTGLAALADELAMGRELPPNVNLGAAYPVGVVLNAARHLTAYLAPIPPQRRHDRHPVQQPASVVAGFANVYQTVATSMPADGTEHWVVENVSRGGFGAWIESRPGDWLKARALVAMQPEGGGSWLLAVVRRHRRLMTPNGVQVGLETLTVRPRAVTLKPRASAGYGAAPGIAALLIQEGNSPGEVRVIMPFATFDLRTPLAGELDGHRFLLTPVAVADRTPDYELARFRMGEFV